MLVSLDPLSVKSFFPNQKTSDETLKLAESYAEGNGVKKDEVMAFKLYKVVADQGNGTALFYLSQYYFNGRGCNEDLELAFKCAQQAAAKGIKEAYYLLGHCYVHGYGTSEDFEKAFESYSIAAESGMPDALYELGLLYESGMGGLENLELAIKCFQQAAEKMHSGALYVLGLKHLDGEGVQKDLQKAFAYFEKAQDENADALAHMGNCYYHGWGIVENQNQAFECWREAKKRGSIWAEAQLICYETPETITRAVKSNNEKSSLVSKPVEHQLPTTEQNIELAFYKNDFDFIHNLLGTAPARKLAQAPSLTDLEGTYFNCLKEAHKKSFFEEQIIYIIMLGNLYYTKGNLITAAKLLNGALSLLLDKKPAVAVVKNYILKKLATIESQYFVQYGISEYKGTEERIINSRRRLQEIRAQAKKALDLNEPIQNIQFNLTEGFKKLLAEHILNIQKLLVKPPGKWACIGMGSMARGEMCPNSDEEFAFLVEEMNTKVLTHFRNLSHILEMQILNCGETKFGILENGGFSFTPSGFSMDSAGNTPLGLDGVYELIGTPEKIAEFQSKLWIDRNIILPNALSTVCLITGDEGLLAAYETCVEKAYKSKGTNASVRNILAFKLLEGHLREFRPDLSLETRSEVEAFGVKKELYRPFQEIMGCLSLFFKLKEKNTLRRIDELQEMKVFSFKGAENIKRAISSVLKLRMELHLFYRNEVENLYQVSRDEIVFDHGPLNPIGISFGSTKSPHLIYLEGDRLAALAEIYSILVPFHLAAEHFLQSHAENAFYQNEFIEINPFVLGMTYINTFQHKKAQEAFQNALALNPMNISALIQLAFVEENLGANKERVLSYLIKALNLVLDRHKGELHPEASVYFGYIAAFYNNLEEYANALMYYQKAASCYQINDVSSAIYHYHISNLYHKLKMVDEAQAAYSKATTLNPLVASSLIAQSDKSAQPFAAPQVSSSRAKKTQHEPVSSSSALKTPPAMTSPQSFMAFGKDKWEKYVGDIGVEPPLPANIESILQSPCPYWRGKKIGETHLLVLIPSKLGTEKTTLSNFVKIVASFRKDFFLKKPEFLRYDKIPEKTIKSSYWALITKDVVPGTLDKHFKWQKEILVKGSKKHKVPRVLEAAIAITMYSIDNPTSIFNATFTLCKEEMKITSKTKHHFAVGNFNSMSLQLGYAGSSDKNVGLAALQKI